MKPPEMIERTSEQIDELLARVERNALQPDDCETIKLIIFAFLYLKQAYEDKKTSIKRLLQMIFGSRSEKTKNIIKPDKDKGTDAKAGDDGLDPIEPTGAKQEEQTGKDNCEANGDKRNKPGHGRNGADAFTGAEKESVAHPDLEPGDPCPHCLCKGKVYETHRGVVMRFFSRAPIQARIWELKKLRCNLCGEIFTPEIPEQAKGPKYDETAVAMIALLRYGTGLPFNRLENLQTCLGIPLPASTQWDKVEHGADLIHPAFTHLNRLGAQGDVIHNDDTPMKILESINSNEDTQDKPQRKGVQTTGIVSISGCRKIALFFTGHRHAGENFADLMNKRASDKDPPIQMCDALSRNYSKFKESILVLCNSHSRRKFVYEAENFPQETGYVLEEVFKKIYKTDAITKSRAMSDQQRMEYHQEHSGPVIDLFHGWLNEQFDQKKVEPNSGLGQAISYVLKHWEGLTRFLHVPGAPLDNNICERALKKAIAHRKNSLFYKTHHGAYIGDMYMSLIHTCVLNGVNPFDYLVALQRHSSQIFKNPNQWMPWNYTDTISKAAA
jgi:transposase